MSSLSVFKNELKEELDRILGYWSAHTIDNEFGGFVGEIDGQGKINPGASKSAVLNARILWTFSAAYNFTNQENYLKLASRAYNYLINQFWDQKNGGIYWELDHKGNPINTRKQAYAQGFGIYGLSEYYKASKNEESLKYAMKLYELVETKFKDLKDEGYIEALALDWSPLSDMRLSEKDANEPKSMNTHLHIIEPYTNLYRVWPDANLKVQMKELLDIFINRIVDQKNDHLNLFFDMDWAVKSTLVSYGHDIEGAWLLTEAAHIYGDKDFLRQVEQTSIKLAESALNQGVDKDGAVLYEKDRGHLDSDKHWWPQAEAMIGFMDAYSITGDKKYFDAVLKSWEFIKSFIIDKKHGEWFWKVNRQGIPDMEDCKVGFWKCPYHNTRALIEVIQRVEKLGNR